MGLMNLVRRLGRLMDPAVNRAIRVHRRTLAWSQRHLCSSSWSARVVLSLVAAALVSARACAASRACLQMHQFPVRLVRLAFLVCLRAVARRIEHTGLVRPAAVMTAPTRRVYLVHLSSRLR
jgi:hypothetical protein